LRVEGNAENHGSQSGERRCFSSDLTQIAGVGIHLSRKLEKVKRETFQLLGAAVFAVVVLVAPLAFAQSNTKDNTKAENPKDAVTSLEIVVTAGPKNAPVDNASVYLRWDEPRALHRTKQMEFDLKTDMEGIAKVKDVPRKKIIVQVVKTGWKPFGQYYDLDKPEQRIEIKLQSPPHWY
jgi:hypothetical protein